MPVNQNSESYTQYYPFGMVTPGRSYSAGDGYRFGFNGQENLEEITESSTYYSFDYRVHDSRLGRFLSVDPLSKSFPWNSPYAFAENRVIDGIDLEGAEHYYYWIKITFTNGKPLLELEYFNTMKTIPWPFETIVGDITIDFPAPGPLYVISFGFFNYFFSTEDEMRQAVDDLQQTFDYAEFLECHCMTNLPEEFTLEFYERQAEGWINFYNMLGGAMGGIMMRAVTIKAPTPRKISTSKM